MTDLTAPDHWPEAATTRSRWRRSTRVLTLTLASGALLLGACGTTTDTDEAARSVADLPAADDSNSNSTGGERNDGDGNGNGGTGGERPEPSQEDVEAAEIRFEQCMADAGIDVGGLFGGSGEAVGDDDGNDGTSAAQIDAGGLDDDEFQAAIDECNAIFEDTFGSFEPSPEEQARLADAEAAFANCMGDAGFEMPEPDGSGAISIELDETIDLDAFEEASERCSAQAFGDDGLFLGDGSTEDE